jgi:hypothetical protein
MAAAGELAFAKSDIKTSKRNALFSQRIRSAFSFPISHSGTDSGRYE